MPTPQVCQCWYGAGTLLDQTLVYVTSDPAWGKTHTNAELGRKAVGLEGWLDVGERVVCEASTPPAP